MVVLPKNIGDFIKKVKAKKQKLVLVTGVFDVLHQEHKNFLIKAKQAGDALVVGLESDKRVRQIKGEGRPVNNQNRRLKNLQKWRIADLVFILPDNFGQSKIRKKLIEEIRPQVLAVSSHTKHLPIKRKIMESVGGEVLIVHRHNPKISSTIIINKFLTK